MNFIIFVPEKLHCILEKVTNFPGQSQVTGPGGKIDNGAIRPNHSQDFANTAS